MNSFLPFLLHWTARDRQGVMTCRNGQSQKWTCTATPAQIIANIKICLVIARTLTFHLMLVRIFSRKLLHYSHIKCYSRGWKVCLPASVSPTVYRKLTHTDRLLDAPSFSPTSHKVTTIKILTRRDQLVSNLQDILADENKYLKCVPIKTTTMMTLSFETFIDLVRPMFNQLLLVQWLVTSWLHTKLSLV